MNIGLDMFDLQTTLEPYWNRLQEQDKEIERLNNIIKEVRELLYKDNVKVFEYFSDDKYDYELITGKVLEILDKEDKDENI